MKPIDYWRLCERLSVRQAAILIMGKDPADYAYHDVVEKPYDALVQAIEHAISVEAIEGMVIIPNEFGSDPNESWIVIDSLKSWLNAKGINTGFFFPKAEDTPHYLDSDNPSYSPKLAAAVSAWTAVTSEKRYTNNGKSPKANIENWLTANAEKFGLVSEDGEINNTAIKDQISKVVNWRIKGGSPATPVYEPAPPPVEPAPVSFEDDSDIPF